MNICSVAGRSAILVYSAVIAAPFGSVLPARSASSPVLCDGGASAAVSAKAAANTCCMTAIASGNSNGCGPACSPTTIGLT